MGTRTNRHEHNHDSASNETLPDWRDGIVGTPFSYLAALGGEASVWLMLLYDFFFWVPTGRLKSKRPQAFPHLRAIY